MCLLLSCPAVVGCAGWRGGSGALRAVSIAEQPRLLRCDYETALYTHDRDAETSFYLTDVGLGRWQDGKVTDGQLMHVRMLWEPKPGATPMDATATNASIRLVIIAAGEIGVYEGGGFVVPSAPPGGRSLAVTVQDGDLRLVRRTARFNDPLTPARVTGGFTAVHDAKGARRLRAAASQFLTDAFGQRQFAGAGVGIQGPGISKPSLPSFAHRGS